MRHEYLVTGDHPIMARPDRYFVSLSEAKAYEDALIRAGYENVVITRVNQE